MAMSLTFRSAVVGVAPSAKLLQAKRISATVKPATTTVALFGKKEPAKPAPPKAKVKGLYGPTGGKPKPAAKPAAKPPFGAKKPAPAKKPAASKPLFSFGASKPAAAKKPVVKKATTTVKKSGFSFGASKTTAAKPAKSKYNIKKSTTGTAIKKKPIVRSKPIATVKVAAPPKPAPKPTTPREPIKYDKEQVGTVGVASIFAGTFLLTLAAIPTVVETALEVVGIGYTAFFTYTYLTSQESRDEFGKKLDEIEESTGLDLKQVAQVTGELADKTSKQLAEQAEKAAEKAAEKKAEAKAEAEKLADKAVESAAAEVEEEAK